MKLAESVGEAVADSGIRDLSVSSVSSVESGAVGAGAGEGVAAEVKTVGRVTVEVAVASKNCTCLGGIGDEGGADWGKVP